MTAPVIVVSSTKGGVGKSTVSWGIATGLARRGYRVGMIAADLEADALGYLAGLNFDKLAGDDLIRPVEREGVKIVGLSLLIEPEWLDTPIMLHEDRKDEIIQQMMNAVDWGELDLMVVDSPPSSGEELRAIVKFLHPEAFIIVTIPQNLAEIPVRRMIRAVRDEFHLPILGIVENNAYNVGGDAGRSISDSMDIPLLARLPWSPEVAAAMDRGEAFDGEAFATLVDKVERQYLPKPEPKKKPTAAKKPAKAKATKKIKEK